MAGACFGHADLMRDALGRPTSGRTDAPLFRDGRTGREFCHECIAALVTWELDGSPEPSERPYPRWLGTAGGEAGAG